MTKQVNPEEPGLMHQLLVQPTFSVVIVLSGDRIVAQQKAPPNRAVHDMHNCDFVRCKQLNPGSSGHAALPLKSLSTVLQNRLEPVNNMVCPRSLVHLGNARSVDMHGHVVYSVYLWCLHVFRGT